jgi:hypothetical protein
MEEAKPLGQGDREIRAGDSLVSIAVAAGHVPDTIWNDAANADLKTARGDGELLLPGDKLTIMPLRIEPVACVTGKTHTFQRKGVPVTLKLVLEDDEAKPFAGKKYELVIDNEKQSGTTDDSGTIECKVTASSGSAELTVWLDEPGLPNPWTHTLRIGELQPKNSLTGIQQRLSNLGFYIAEDLTGLADAETGLALGAFIAEQQLTVDDQLDDSVLDKLVEVHRV